MIEQVRFGGRGALLELGREAPKNAALPMPSRCVAPSSAILGWGLPSIASGTRTT